MLKDKLLKKGLSQRESEVGVLVSQGLTNKEVAEKLFVTEKTVKFHLTNVYKKMNIKSRIELIMWAFPKMDFISETEKPQPIVLSPDRVESQEGEFLPHSMVPKKDNI